MWLFCPGWSLKPSSSWLNSGELIVVLIKLQRCSGWFVAYRIRRKLLRSEHSCCFGSCSWSARVFGSTSLLDSWFCRFGRLLLTRPNINMLRFKHLRTPQPLCTGNRRVLQRKESMWILWEWPAIQTHWRSSSKPTYLELELLCVLMNFTWEWSTMTSVELQRLQEMSTESLLDLWTVAPDTG